ncbi:hypothetical protein F4810DRAFT_719097 [Camillea tinctor]|nr:hypothetical protein F4810DRAFT_719097 [Camillea tinctor]
MGSYNTSHNLPHEAATRYSFTHNINNSNNEDDHVNPNTSQPPPLDGPASNGPEPYLNPPPLEFPIRIFSHPAWRDPLDSPYHHRPPSPRPRSPPPTYPFHSSPFHPRAATAHSLPALLPGGVSPNYRGNPFLPANQSADIPDAENTSLWLTNLPPNCTHRMLLSAVRGCGKVYATVVNPPVAAQNHITSACKLVFFDVAGAQALLLQARAGLFSVGGYVPRVRHNRIRSAARPPGPQSRVLHIEGPGRVVNERFLTAFFRARFQYEVESVEMLGRFGDRTRLEWRFGSYRCQAESARTWIAREKERCSGILAAAAAAAVRPCGVVPGGGGGGGGASGTGGTSGGGDNGSRPRLFDPNILYRRSSNDWNPNDYMSEREILLRQLQTFQHSTLHQPSPQQPDLYPPGLQQQQENQAQAADLEECLAWQAVTVHFAVDPSDYTAKDCSQLHKDNISHLILVLAR